MSLKFRSLRGGCRILYQLTGRPTGRLRLDPEVRNYYWVHAAIRCSLRPSVRRTIRDSCNVVLIKSRAVDCNKLYPSTRIARPNNGANWTTVHNRKADRRCSHPRPRTRRVHQHLVLVAARGAWDIWWVRHCAEPASRPTDCARGVCRTFLTWLVRICGNFR